MSTNGDSNTKFAESAFCIEWLSQFDASDSLIAKSVIDSMWFVPAREVHVALWQNIEFVINASGVKKVAFYTVSNKKPGVFGSQDMIGYFLEHVKEFSKVPCSTNPSEKKLLADGYSHIVLVEDISASGGTLHKFCKKFITPKIRSRISSGKLELHISCYCAYEHALSHVKKASKSLKPENLHACIRLDKRHTYFNATQVDFFRRWKKHQYPGFHPLGYGKTGCPVVFEYSCPNNTPAIFHKRGPDYTSLFPNKKIPSEARPLFNEENRTPVFNLLTQMGVQNLDRIQELNLESGSDFANFTAYLKLFSKGIKPTNFQKHLIHTSDKIDKMINRLIALGLVDKNNQISGFGKELLRKLSSAKAKKFAESFENQPIYIPTKINKISRGDQ